MRKWMCILGFIATGLVGYSQSSGKEKIKFKERLALGVEVGAYLDQSMLENEYLVRPNLTLNILPYILISPKHFIGLHIGQQGCDIKYKEIEEAFYQGADHEELKSMTSGYDNIYQLGVTYRYVQVFENGFTLIPGCSTGALWAIKEGHHLDYYPDSNNPNIVKRFGTYPADNHVNIGYYLSAKFSAGYHWQNSGFTLFGGFRYLTGEVEQKNQYVEEWANSGVYTSVPYFENRLLSMFTLEAGIILCPFSM